MTKNMGWTYRRLAVAAGIGALILSGRVRGRAALGTLANVCTGTSTTGRCPAYVPFDVDTRA